jgi:hypothetical protein
VTTSPSLPLLAGLPAAYSMVVTVIESSEDELTLDDVVTKLLNTEARVAREETAEAHAAAPPSKYAHMEAWTCYHCGKKGYISRDCKARIQAQRQSSHATALMAGLGASSSTAWLVDSGASHHVCSDKSMLTNLRASNVKSLITANHVVASVKGQGDVQLRVHGSSNVVEVCDVLYVPDVVANLLSVGKLAGQGMPGVCTGSLCVGAPRGTLSFRCSTQWSVLPEC